jgi:hypothetical protein
MRFTMRFTYACCQLPAGETAQSFDDGNFPDREIISSVDILLEAVCGNATLMQAVDVKPGPFESRNDGVGISQLHGRLLLCDSTPNVAVIGRTRGKTELIS